MFSAYDVVVANGLFSHTLYRDAYHRIWQLEQAESGWELVGMTVDTPSLNLEELKDLDLVDLHELHYLEI